MIKAVVITNKWGQEHTVRVGRRPLGVGTNQRKRRKYARQTPQSSKFKR